ncbi:3-deoxy-manno-octulosonate cytidylyltransferase [Persephonella sp.]
MATIIIPARLNSTRLKNKLILKVKGKPIIQWTAENCLKVKNAERVIVATDSEKIQNIFKGRKDIEVIITPSDLQSGSDRVAYVSKSLNTEKIINVQGDEPLLDPEDIEKVISELDKADVTTLAYPIEREEDYLNPNTVKVVTDKNGYALYFSRSPIPFIRDRNFKEIANKYKNIILKHIGIYGYQKEALMEFAFSSDPAPIEQIEKLEQLRILYSGRKIKVIKANKDSLGIDTEEDFLKFCELAEKLKV